MITPPVSRLPRRSSSEIRRELGLDPESILAMITMGGIQTSYDFLDRLKEWTEFHFIVPGGADDIIHSENVILLPHRSRFFHPDLIAASDIVIGKVGYSTIAEVYHAGPPFGYVVRPAFRESGVLAAFIKSNMNAVEIGPEDFLSGNWRDELDQLRLLPKSPADLPNGSAEIARYVTGLFDL